MKTLLTIADRLSLQNIMPGQDSFENLCIREEIMSKIKFSSEEIETNRIKTIEGGVTFVETESKEYEFNAISVVYVQAQLKRLSEAKELQAIAVPLYRKFNEIK